MHYLNPKGNRCSFKFLSVCLTKETSWHLMPSAEIAPRPEPKIRGGEKDAAQKSERALTAQLGGFAKVHDIGLEGFFFHTCGGNLLRSQQKIERFRPLLMVGRARSEVCRAASLCLPSEYSNYVGRCVPRYCGLTTALEAARRRRRRSIIAFSHLAMPLVAKGDATDNPTAAGTHLHCQYYYSLPSMASFRCVSRRPAAKCMRSNLHFSQDCIRMIIKEIFLVEKGTNAGFLSGLV